MNAIVNVDNVVRPIRRSVPRIEPLTEQDVKDPKRLVRAYNQLLELALKLAVTQPLEYIEYEDVSVTAASTYMFRHGFKGRVRWYPVDWSDTVGAPSFYEVVASSDDNTLALKAVVTGKVTMRIQRSSQ